VESDYGMGPVGERLSLKKLQVGFLEDVTALRGRKLIDKKKEPRGKEVFVKGHPALKKKDGIK